MDAAPSGMSRRKQIVEAAIVVIARNGIGSASFEQIRAEAGISSTRLISYHFDSKDELQQTVLAHIVGLAGEVMSPLIAAAGTAREKLGAYIRGNLSFLAERPDYAVAAIEVIGITSSTDAGDADPLLVQLFAEAQKSGELREFDPNLMAWVLRAAVDRVVLRFARVPETDLQSAASELVELFDRAVRPD
jgi:AcrR family transcriptional regulator